MVSLTKLSAVPVTLVWSNQISPYQAAFNCRLSTLYLSPLYIYHYVNNIEKQVLFRFARF